MWNNWNQDVVIPDLRGLMKASLEMKIQTHGMNALPNILGQNLCGHGRNFSARRKNHPGQAVLRAWV